MRKRIVSWLLALSIIFGVCPMLAVNAEEPPGLISWTDDGFKRYAQTEAAPDEPSQSISLEAARNEYERGQIVVKSDAQDFTITAVEFTPLKNADGGQIAVENLAYHFALYEVNIPTDHCGMPWEPSMQGKPLYAKDSMCDALSNAASISVAKGCNQPIYLEVYVPADTQPGFYEGQVTVKTSLGDIQKELTVQVYSATVPELEDAGFTYFNWMTDIAQGYYTEWNAFTSYYDIEDVNADGTDFTQDFYDILNNWAEIATDHRQNMVMISTTALLDAANSKVDGDGHYTFDWTLFDKYVDVWLNHGVTRLAGIHFGYHAKDVMLKDDGKGNAAFAWESYSVDQVKYDKAKDNWYRQYLPALAEHLEKYDILRHHGREFGGLQNLPEVLQPHLPHRRVELFQNGNIDHKRYPLQHTKFSRSRRQRRDCSPALIRLLRFTPHPSSPKGRHKPAANPYRAANFERRVFSADIQRQLVTNPVPPHQAARIKTPAR